MQSVNECYKKVKKDCFKFIKSQETPKEKFKNIERMVESFLIPISIWIAGKTNKKKPYIVGLGGDRDQTKQQSVQLLQLF